MKLILKRILFYFLSFTWGIVLSLVGLLMLIPFAFAKKVRVFHGRLYGVFPKCFGSGWGFEMGCFFFTSYDCVDNDHLRSHECGHGLQNIMFGVFQIFIQLASLIRFWYRELHFYKKGKKPTTEYDSIWFEKMATYLGTKYVFNDRI